MHKFLLRLCLAVLLVGPGSAMASLIVPTPDDKDLLLGRQVDVLVDPEGAWDIDDVSTTFAGRFQPSQSANPSFGFTRSVIWLRFTLDLDQVSGRNWFLIQRHPIVDHMHLYMPDGQGGFDVSHMGDVLPFGERVMQVREFVFPLNMDLRGPQTYYMKVHGLGALHIEMRLSSTQGLVERTYREQLAFGLFLGGVVAMLLYNLLLFFTVRDTSYLYYLLFIVGFALSFVNINGLGLQYLWPELPVINEYFPFLMGITMAAVIQFSRRFLGLDQRRPRQDRVLRYLLHGTVLLTVLSLVIPPPLSYFMIVFWVLLIVPTLTIVSWQTWRAGYQAARLYVLAWFFFLGGCGVFALMNLGVLPHLAVTNYAPHFGGAWAIILMSLALGDRIKLLQRERDEMAEDARLTLESHVAEVERMDRDKTLFLEYLSHELNTPLNWLAGARLVHSSEAQTDLADVVGMVQHGQDRLQQLVSTSLRYFDLVGREGEPALSHCQPMWMLDDLLQQQEKNFKARNLTLHNRVPADLLLVGCEKELKEVLGMALENAAHYSDADSDIVADAEIDTRRHLATIRITDTGRGLDGCDLERIFQPFFMIGSGHQANGFGLSLPTAKLMMDHMGGEMWAESAGRGAGLTLCVRLPMAVL
ncbi:sensor histidine kinase [Alcanivorax sp. JB21]|uniref:sensor histidine kinase n=1 Tax=Alcanivorax limicola TaxID=2874102 RepID=UPI001CC091F7|nr:sensor histidine kinase [Alcanivorax limicola]MBZ2189232.1 sensor histidine kinase [Alcanivorax limicola]